MKKLALALILAVVVTVSFATPAFAGPPEDKPGPGNMPDGAQDALTDIVTFNWTSHHMFISFAAWIQGNNSQAVFHVYTGALNAIYQIRDLLGG